MCYLCGRPSFNVLFFVVGVVLPLLKGVPWNTLIVLALTQIKVSSFRR